MVYWMALNAKEEISKVYRHGVKVVVLTRLSVRTWLKCHLLKTWRLEWAIQLSRQRSVQSKGTQEQRLSEKHNVFEEQQVGTVAEERVSG